MTEMVPELTNGEFENFIKKKISLIDFFAEWCMPCVMMGPIIEDVSEKFSGKIKIGKLNVEDNRDIAKKFGVFSIPTFIIFKEGKTVDKIIGSTTQEELEKFIKKHL